jgi:hypothetical protein
MRRVGMESIAENGQREGQETDREVKGRCQKREGDRDWTINFK